MLSVLVNKDRARLFVRDTHAQTQHTNTQGQTGTGSQDSLQTGTDPDSYTRQTGQKTWRVE